jgi:glycosyltransferase involved in cell wall biosynthesis
MRVLHISTGLNVGGAEMMLYRILQARDPADSHHVVSLIDVGLTGQKIAKLGIEPRALGMRRVPNPLKLIELARMIAEVRPDVVQTWMYHADLIGGLAARLAGCTRVAWGIHNYTLDPATTHRTTKLIVAALARLSPFVPDAIVCVSQASEVHHVSMGYDARKFVIIPNGFDCTEFQPNEATRREMRRELGLADEHVLIGMVARIAPQKDHPNFIRAAIALARRRPEVRFLLCGGPGVDGAKGTTLDNTDLAGPLREAGLLNRFFLLGRRDDIPRIMSALDIAALSSYGEAFPLVIGEAMACGVPCVVTDVGDSGLLVAETGRVVPPRDPEALAGAWEDLVALGTEGRRRLGEAARARIKENFSLPHVAEQYAALWRRLVIGTAARGGRFFAHRHVRPHESADARAAIRPEGP